MTTLIITLNLNLTIMTTCMGILTLASSPTAMRTLRSTLAPVSRASALLA
jgi:hypothetical protein